MQSTKPTRQGTIARPREYPVRVERPVPFRRQTALSENAGYQHSRLNALSHGLTARHAVLPWEDANAYQALLAALLAEHQPMGPTERHLVEQLAALFCRQHRVLQAELASIRDGLREQLDVAIVEPFRNGALAHLGDARNTDTSTAVQATEQDNQAALAELADKEVRLQRSLRILKRGGPRAYERALATLPENLRDAWAEELEEAAAAQPVPADDVTGEGPARASSPSLRHFMVTWLLPAIARQQQEIQRRPLVRDHAFGMAIVNADLERLGRYETHLTRQMQRILAMLMRLQENRTTSRAMPPDPFGKIVHGTAGILPSPEGVKALNSPVLSDHLEPSRLQQRRERS